LLLVLTESVLIAGVGGTVGLLLAKGLAGLGDPTHGFLPLFYLPLSAVPIGLGLALAVGIASGLLPAISAMRLRVVDALRRV
jgi:putative ABC transport system permease protein